MATFLTSCYFLFPKNNLSENIVASKLSADDRSGTCCHNFVSLYTEWHKKIVPMATCSKRCQVGLFHEVLRNNVRSDEIINGNFVTNLLPNVIFNELGKVFQYLARL